MGKAFVGFRPVPVLLHNAPPEAAIRGDGARFLKANGTQRVLIRVSSGFQPLGAGPGGIP